MASNDSDTCSKTTPWGRCQQTDPDPQTGLCSAHLRWEQRGITPDRTYERKIVLGLLQSTFDYMSDDEAEVLLSGRYRGDGRRLDAWITGEAVEWRPSA